MPGGALISRERDDNNSWQDSRTAREVNCAASKRIFSA